MKTCTKCKIDKGESEFWKDKYATRGLSPACKECRRTARSAKHYKLREKRELAKARAEKKCNKCHATKFLDEFDRTSRALDGRQGICKECSSLSRKLWYTNGGKETQSRWYGRNKTKVASAFRSKRDAAKVEFINLLGGCCAHCLLPPSDTLPVACFDFHHTGKGKEMNISKVSRLVRPYDNESTFIELSKCIVLCSNCHRKHHYFNGR